MVQKSLSEAKGPCQKQWIASFRLRVNCCLRLRGFSSFLCERHEISKMGQRWKPQLSIYWLVYVLTLTFGHELWVVT